MPGKGPAVARLDWDQARQIYDIRLLLEQAAARGCAERVDDAVRADLQAALAGIGVAFDTGEGLLAATMRFYEVIFRAAGQGIAWEIVQRLNGRISRLRALTLATKERNVSGQARMARICAAICAGDSDGAAEAVRAHLTEATEIARGAAGGRGMKGYWIAQVTVTDPARYAGYQALAPAAFAAFGATFLARGGAYEVKEGAAFDRHVVIEFPSLAAAQACYDSAEYQAARAARDGAAEVQVVLVEGL